jgi:beta-glucanase (GH16 family)
VRLVCVIAAILIALVLTACSASSPQAPTPPAPTGNPPGRWQLKFDDVFTGQSLDTSDWSTGWLAPGITPPVNSNELECYNPADVAVSGGALVLSLEGRAGSCGGTQRPYASGLVNTDGKFEFTYGFMEARIWLPGQGQQITNWPAFWADGQNWPQDGEIDVVEGLDGLACWHFENPDGNPGGCVPGTFTNGWHTFGADWEPGSITYYYDGRRVGRVTSGVTSAPMFLILNYATSHQHGGPLDVPATMRVEYVRVWQHPK